MSTFRIFFIIQGFIASMILALVLFPFQTLMAQFVKGADIGWLDQMEATDYRFLDSTGAERNCLEILKDYEINTIRLRVWVNPSEDRINGHCSKNEVIGMALRAHELGMRIMIDFHYSDSWADPAKQTKPAAWATHSFNQLLDDVYNHTFAVVDSMKRAGVTPEWVQVGNEIIGGMLWPDGSTDHWPQLAQLLNKGYEAIKAVDPDIRVILHIDQGNDIARSRWFFDNIRNNNVQFDIIGLSYYPYWLGTDYTATINALGNNLKDMVSRYGKPVMIVEVGGESDKVLNTRQMLLAVLQKVREVPDNKGLGVIYWEPEGDKTWSGYPLSCWGTDHKPTAAMNAFRSHGTGMNLPDMNQKILIYPNPSFDGNVKIKLAEPSAAGNMTIYDLSGRELEKLTLGNPAGDIHHLALDPGLYLIAVDVNQIPSFKTLVVR